MRTELCSEARFLSCQPNIFYSGTSRGAAPGIAIVKDEKSPEGASRTGHKELLKSKNRLNSPATGRSKLAGSLAGEELN